MRTQDGYKSTRRQGFWGRGKEARALTKELLRRFLVELMGIEPTTS